MHFVVGHAQAGERLADLVGGQRAAAVPVKVRKRRRKVLLLQQERMLLATGGGRCWCTIEHMQGGKQGSKVNTCTMAFQQRAVLRILAHSSPLSRNRLNIAFL